MPEEHRGFWTRISQLSLRLKVAGIFVIVVLLAVVATLVLLLIFNLGQQKDSAASLGIPERPKVSSDAYTAGVQLTQYDGEIRDSAKQAIGDGDTVKAKAIYQSVIDSEATVARKIKLTLDESEVFYAAGKHGDAITIAQSAEGLSSDKFLVADWLSRLYEDQKQYSQAVKYYTLAGKWADSPTNAQKFPKSYYDSQVDRVTKLEGKS